MRWRIERDRRGQLQHSCLHILARIFVFLPGSAAPRYIYVNIVTCKNCCWCSLPREHILQMKPNRQGIYLSYPWGKKQHAREHPLSCLITMKCRSIKRWGYPSWWPSRIITDNLIVHHNHLIFVFGHHHSFATTWSPFKNKTPRHTYTWAMRSLTEVQAEKVKFKIIQMGKK
jgi:hypothetical protein